MQTAASYFVGLLCLTSIAGCQPARKEHHQMLRDGQARWPTARLPETIGNKCLVEAEVEPGSQLAAALQELEIAPVGVPQATSAIPPEVKRCWECLAKGKLVMANPGESWQAGDSYSEPGPPRRQLAYLGVGKQVVVLAYFAGGFVGKYENVLVFKKQGTGISGFWQVQTRSSLTTKPQVLDFIKQGGAGESIGSL